MISIKKQFFIRYKFSKNRKQREIQALTNSYKDRRRGLKRNKQVQNFNWVLNFQ